MISMGKYDPEAMIFVLEDVRAVFDANGMHGSADSIVDALRVVREECKRARVHEDFERQPLATQHYH